MVATPAVESSAGIAPVSGPWPFTVHDTEGLGLYVRDGPEASDERLEGGPTAPDGAVLWVECVTYNDFDADPATGVGGTWYRIHWPEPTSPADAWAYGGYLAALHTAPDLPTCTP